MQEAKLIVNDYFEQWINPTNVKHNNLYNSWKFPV